MITLEFDREELNELMIVSSVVRKKILEELEIELITREDIVDRIENHSDYKPYNKIGTIKICRELSVGDKAMIKLVQGETKCYSPSQNEQGECQLGLLASKVFVERNFKF